MGEAEQLLNIHVVSSLDDEVPLAHHPDIVNVGVIHDRENLRILIASLSRVIMRPDLYSEKDLEIISVVVDFRKLVENGAKLSEDELWSLTVFAGMEVALELLKKIVNIKNGSQDSEDIDQEIGDDNNHLCLDEQDNWREDEARKWILLQEHAIILTARAIISTFDNRGNLSLN